MKVRLNMRRSSQGRSLLLSLIGHFAAFSALTQFQFSPPSKRPIYDQFVKPKDHEILYYRPPKVHAEAAPEQQAGPKKEARAWMIAPKTAIAQAPNPLSQKQILLQSAAVKELTIDVPVPSVIAHIETTGIPLPPKPAARKFTAPPPSKEEPKLATRSLISNDPAPSIDTGGTPLPTVPSPSVGNLPSQPRENLPQAPVPAPGNAKADVAIASLNPAPATESVPLANRPGAFARAPNPGDTSPGNNPGALTTPNITVRDPAPPPAGPPKTVVNYNERVRSSALSTLSAPLRPSGRSVPRSLESRFTGRSVYAMVIPIENMPAYDGDWVLWFAEISPAAGQTPLIRAPSPNHKLEAEMRRAQAVARVQISAVIGRDGKLRGASIISSAAGAVLSPSAQAWVLDDLQSWEFMPAMRSGIAIEVDAVFDIPFHLPQ